LVAGVIGICTSLVTADFESDVKKIEDLKMEVHDQSSRRAAIRRVGKAGTDTAARTLVELLCDSYDMIRQVAFEALVGMSGSDVDTVLIEEGLAHDNAIVRREVCDILAIRKPKQAAEPLTRVMKRDKDDSVPPRAARAVGFIGGEDAKGELERGLKRKGALGGQSAIALARLELVDEELSEDIAKLAGDRDWQGAVGALDAIKMVGPDPWLEDLGDALKNRDWRPRIALAQCLAAVDSDEQRAYVVELYTELLEDDDWRVRRRTIEALVDWWQVEAIKLLIDTLEEEEGSLRYDIVHALVALCGGAFGYNTEAWKLWWVQKGESYQLREKPKRPRNGWLKAPDKDQVEREGGGHTATFFNVPVFEQDSTFVFDMSGSMRNEVSKDDPRIKGDIALQELARTLESMPEGADFNVQIFRFWSEWPQRTQEQSAFDSVQPLTDKNIKKAREWIASQEIRGYGAFYEAILMACKDPSVEVVYFLSDGGPSQGRYCEKSNCAPALLEALRFYPVTIHTVLIGGSNSDEKFMEELAQQHGGSMVNTTGGEG
jgi:HEAT repeat protein